jgi:Phytanoyl-CoA dioxygenase (PhyH)
MFADSSLQREYDMRGYVVVDLLSPDTVRRARAAWGGGDPHMAHYPFSATVMSRDPAYRRSVHGELSAELRAPVGELLPGFDLLYCMYNNKQATGPSSVVGLHQDWSLVDESQSGSAAVFCALSDLDEQYGCLFAIDGSQGLTTGPRSMYNVLAYPELEHVFLDHAVLVPMRAGQACVHSLSVFHGSVPNVADQARLAIGALAVERGAPLRHYVAREGGDLEALDVDREFFFDLVYGVTPAGGRSLGCVQPERRALSEEDLNQWLADNQPTLAGPSLISSTAPRQVR